MKERITVTMDRDLIVRAKLLAHHRGTSLSNLVELSLQASMAPQTRAARSFVERWAGKFTVRDGGSEDPRLQALKAKHSLM
jgi:hypothetical protein